MRWPAYVLFSCTLILSAQPIPDASPNFYSREKEAALGTQLAQQFRSTATLVDNAAALRYVEQMGAKLVAQLPEPRFTYSFALIDSNGLGEPVAIPGEYIFVPVRLFLTAQNDGEFAGLLAHSIAHVSERHFTRVATQNSIAQMSLSVIPLIYGGNSTLIAASLAKFNRIYEQEADKLAMNMVSAAGYDAEGLIRYLSRERTANSPDSEALNERIAAMQSAILDSPPAASGEFLQVQKQLRNPRN